eukprot:SAG31_NODE_48_length_30945_cov_16.254263_34_plen_102_part_00
MLGRVMRNQKTITITTRKKEWAIRVHAKEADDWMKQLVAAAAKPRGAKADKKAVPAWQQRQAARWREGVVMLSVRFSMERHIADETATSGERIGMRPHYQC